MIKNNLRKIITKITKNYSSFRLNRIKSLNAFQRINAVNFSSCGNGECGQGGCDKKDHGNNSQNETSEENKDDTTNKTVEDDQASGCGNSQCGCHPHSNAAPTKEDLVEMELKAKHYKILECINAGKYDDALELSEDFINIVKTNFGDEHPFYCSAINNKAFILKTCGEFDEAIVLFNEVVDKYKRIYGDNNEKVIITLHNLATVLKDNKEFDKSLEIYERIIKMISKENIVIEGEKKGGLRLNIFANVYNSAGGLYRQLKNFKEADKLFALAYSIIKENFGEDTPPIATVLNNMALSLKDQGKPEEAMEKYQRALKIRKGHLDENHPEVELIKHNIEQLKNDMLNKSINFPAPNKNI